MSLARVIERQEILLPARPGFIAATLVAAFLLNLLPWGGTLATLTPDFVAVLLLYWSIHQPRRLGFTPGFLLGLAMDIAEASLFGQHALAYTVLTYGAITLHRRILMFGIRHQVLHVLPLLVVAQLIMLIVRLAAGASFPGMSYFVASLAGAALWPALAVLLQLPQRPRPDPDHAAI